MRALFLHVTTAVMIFGLLAAPFTPQPVLVVGMLLAALAGIKIALGARGASEGVG